MLAQGGVRAGTYVLAKPTLPSLAQQPSHFLLSLGLIPEKYSPSLMMNDAGSIRSESRGRLMGGGNNGFVWFKVDELSSSRSWACQMAWPTQPACSCTIFPGPPAQVLLHPPPTSSAPTCPSTCNEQPRCGHPLPGGLVWTDPGPEPTLSWASQPPDSMS